jgi:hypothetical protein
MDRTIKFLLGVIAASLLMLNLQLAGVSLVKDAHAQWSSSTFPYGPKDTDYMKKGFKDVAKAIREASKKCQS